MEKEKKNVAIMVLIVALIGSGVGNVVLEIMGREVRSPPELNVLKYACSENSAPAVLDPVDSWDSVSNDVIRQVCDNLWYYDLCDPDFALQMRLATSYEYNTAKDQVEVILRENIYFHDGSLFNATAVKFTFDRILYFINATGTLPNYSRLCDPASLFINMQGISILNKTVINSEYNVTFFLNAPNAIFVPLLTYDACAILHPDSTPATEYLELERDILTGTGPFEYVHLFLGYEMRFKRFDMYWGPNTFWDEVIWVYYPDSVAAANALLGGEVDAGGALTSMIDLYIADPDLIFVNLGTSTIFRYFGLNNRKINETLVRKAIAYAYNYSYFIDVIRQGYAIRAHQYLPPGFPYYNATFKAPYWNVTIAREAMMAARPTETAGLTSQDWGVNATNDAAWSALNLITYYILEHSGWSAGIEMNLAFAADMDRIGIHVYGYDFEPFEPWEYIWSINYDILGIWYTGYVPDYLDPFAMIEPLLSNLSSANHLQLNDPEIMGWLAEYEQETDTTEKAKLLYKIQDRAVNELYVALPVSFDMVMAVHHRSVGNPCVNIQRNLWFRDSYFIPGVPTAS